ncbi:SDR family NAD(P)-dependent oxidoreductase [bacterium]|nr:SDR family NAD(P)-dependent oxidoreductase [bacterium]
MPGIKDLTDHVAVVTGAGSGIGKTTAIGLAQAGANIVLADIRDDRLDQVTERIRSLGRKAWPHVVDVAQREQVAELARQVEKEAGFASILFNNAGVAMAGEVVDTSLDDFAWIMGINFWGPMHGIKEFLPSMIAQGRGHIVTTASFMGLCPTPGTAGYSVTKAAVIALSEALRLEARRHGVGVSVVCPGIINTGIVADSRYHEVPGGASKKSTVEFYRKRGWPPERVAQAVLRAIRKDLAVVPVGPEAWGPWYLKRLSPGLFEWVSHLAWRRLRGKS